MVGAVGIILEIASIRIEANTEPIIRDADIESTYRITEGQVEFLRVVRICQSVTAPGCQAQAFIANAERWLNSGTSSIQTTPDVTADDITRYRCLYFFRFFCKGAGTHRQPHRKQ